MTLHAQVEFQLKQMLEILKLRLSKRGIDLACIEVKDPQTNLAAATQEVRAAGRASTRKPARRSRASSRTRSSRCRASLQGDKVRVQGKQRDDLQAAMQLLRTSKIEVPLQFNNFETRFEPRRHRSPCRALRCRHGARAEPRQALSSNAISGRCARRSGS